MGIFDFLRGPDINAGIETYRNTERSVLLDVRTEREFAEGHIPGSVNIPVGEIEKASTKIKNRTTPIFTYCLSGARSGQAAAALKRMGFENVTSIGGISAYRGKVVR